MALSDALKAEAGKKPGPRCIACILIDRLSDDDTAALDAAFADLSITSTAIVRALASEGHKIGAETIRRHRAGNCLQR